MSVGAIMFLGEAKRNFMLCFDHLITIKTKTKVGIKGKGLLALGDSVTTSTTDKV